MELDEVRQRLDDARAAVRKWKGRTADAEARADAARRETPSIAVLKQVFAHRLTTLPARTAGSSRDDSERQFLKTSEAYRRVLGEGFGALSGQAQRSALEGLVWWTPGAAADTRFPYRVILQTREVASGGVMLDLGANVGRMAVPRVVLGDVTRAYCAEPDPLTFACLARNVIDNGLRGLVLPDQTAIGDRDGTARLLRTGASGNFRLVADAVTRNVVEVPCCTLDTWVDRLQIDLDAVTFVKVDVEGSERRVLAGAARVLAHRHIAWQMEIKPAGLRATGDEPGDLYEDLQRAFTHFIDLNRAAAGRRVRPVLDLPAALAYIEPDSKTDILLFSTREAIA